MKKFVSLVLAIMLISVFCVPAFAEDTLIECKPDKDGKIIIPGEGNYIISQSCTVENIKLYKNCTLTVPENVTVTVTDRIDISSSGTLCIFGTVDYSRGYLPISQDRIIVGDTGGYFGPDGEKILGKSFSSSVQDPHRYTTLFSGGNLTIIVGIAAAVVFGLGGFFIGKAAGKKKKPALASGENTDEE